MALAWLFRGHLYKFKMDATGADHQVLQPDRFVQEAVTAYPRSQGSIVSPVSNPPSSLIVRN